MAGVWLVEDDVPQLRLSRAPIWYPSGGGGTREVGGTVAECLIGRSSALLGEYTPDSARVEDRSIVDERNAEHLCARTKGANREVSEGKADL